MLCIFIEVLSSYGAFVIQFSLGKNKNANYPRGVRTVGVLLFLDALFWFFNYVNFSCLSVDLNKRFTLATSYLRLSFHIDKSPVALRATDLIVY